MGQLVHVTPMQKNPTKYNQVYAREIRTKIAASCRGRKFVQS